MREFMDGSSITCADVLDMQAAAQQCARVASLGAAVGPEGATKQLKRTRRAAFQPAEAGSGPTLRGLAAAES